MPSKSKARALEQERWLRILLARNECIQAAVDAVLAEVGIQVTRPLKRTAVRAALAAWEEGIS
jgi:hypothetical protein